MRQDIDLGKLRSLAVGDVTLELVRSTPGLVRVVVDEALTEDEDSAWVARADANVELSQPFGPAPAGRYRLSLYTVAGATENARRCLGLVLSEQGEKLLYWAREMYPDNLAPHWLAASVRRRQKWPDPPRTKTWKSVAFVVALRSHDEPPDPPRTLSYDHGGTVPIDPPAALGWGRFAGTPCPMVPIEPQADARQAQLSRDQAFRMAGEAKPTPIEAFDFPVDRLQDLVRVACAAVPGPVLVLRTPDFSPRKWPLLLSEGARLHVAAIQSQPLPTHPVVKALPELFRNTPSGQLTLIVAGLVSHWDGTAWDGGTPTPTVVLQGSWDGERWSVSRSTPAVSGEVWLKALDHADEEPEALLRSVGEAMGWTWVLRRNFP